MADYKSCAWYQNGACIRDDKSGAPISCTDCEDYERRVVFKIEDFQERNEETSNRTADWFADEEQRERIKQSHDEISNPYHSELITPKQMHYCGAIVGHYGKDTQKIQAIQELSELICALTRRPDQQDENYQLEVLDEIADSIIMIEQMRRAHDITIEMLNARIEEKLDRQLRRISRQNWKADDEVIGIRKE